MPDKDNINRKHNSKINVEDLNIQEQVLWDIDRTVVEHYKSMNMTVIENNEKIPVPIRIASPEKWALTRDDLPLRDDNQHVILPIIALKRNSIRNMEEVYVLPNDLTRITMKNKFSEHNQYRDLVGAVGTQPIREMISINAPIKVEISYTMKIWCKFETSMNSIITNLLLNYPKFEIVNENNYALRGTLADFTDTSNYEEFSTENRIISAESDVLVQTMMYSLYKDGKLNIKKVQSPGKITFSEEIIS